MTDDSSLGTSDAPTMSIAEPSHHHVGRAPGRPRHVDGIGSSVVERTRTTSTFTVSITALVRIRNFDKRATTAPTTDSSTAVSNSSMNASSATHTTRNSATTRPTGSSNNELHVDPTARFAMSLLSCECR